jgi:thiol-disulfide isomerase/thioredoxin
MRLLIFSALFVVAFEDENGVVVLTDATFEHDTQVTTGATTGDWFVKFYAPWCSHCKTLAPLWEKVAGELKGELNVAKVNVVENPGVQKRFGVDGFPTLLFFSHGKKYEFPRQDKKGKPLPDTVERMVKFARGGFQKLEGTAIPKEPTLLEAILAYPVQDLALVAVTLAGTMAFLSGIIYWFCCPARKKATKKSKKA